MKKLVIGSPDLAVSTATTRPGIITDPAAIARLDATWNETRGRHGAL